MQPYIDSSYIIRMALEAEHVKCHSQMAFHIIYIKWHNGMQYFTLSADSSQCAK